MVNTSIANADIRRPGTGYGTSRPVMVTFSSVAAKMAVKRQSWKLAGKAISLDHAITTEQQRLRAMQWPQIQAAKVQGTKWFWSDIAPHKLIVASELHASVPK